MNKMEDILNYLKSREQQEPSVGEIAAAISMSLDTTQHMLTVLQERGYIAWESSMTKTVRLVRPA